MFLVLRASELSVAWIVGLYAAPTLGLHATPIDPLRHFVFGFGVLDTLAVVGLELAKATTRGFPVVLTAARQKECE